ncbi:hypothetical protein PUN28_010163 [Cardiocondyla obscurior]|uniref:Uncharacterized protein n=1 Tax=Cardiocondyla obscurior TaxID=286306 RepID=A0AAW2FQS8_9HYME
MSRVNSNISIYSLDRRDENSRTSRTYVSKVHGEERWRDGEMERRVGRVTRRETIPRIVTNEYCVSNPVNDYFNATQNHVRIRNYEIRAHSR